MGNPKFAEIIKATLIEFFQKILKVVFPDFVELDLKLIKIENLRDDIIAPPIADYILAGVTIKDKHVSFKELVNKKNIAFFVENKKTFFADLPIDKVDEFLDMLVKPEKDGGLSQETKDNIWQYFKVIILACERYKKNP